MPEKIIKKVIVYNCDECGGSVEYSGKYEIVNRKQMWVHYCTECQNRYDFRRIYPVYEDVDNE